MKRLIVSTTTRADYGLLSPIIKKLADKPSIDVRVVATGAHVSDEYGYTIQEIFDDDVKVDRKIPILSNMNDANGIVETMANALSRFSNYFNEMQPNALLVLGDRYETLAICCAAMIHRIPIIHLYGGETTEGAIDESIRHAISKMSNIHLVANEDFKRRIVQMGEDPKRVFTVGAMGIENAKNMPLIQIDALSEMLDCPLNNYAVLTFHPVTLENNTAEAQTKELLAAIEQFPDIMFICTKANADENGQVINGMIEKYVSTHRNARLYDSLGAKKYLSAIKNSLFVIGNSSSGLAEPPTFGVVTINIGDRQKGRPQGKSIINCEPKKKEIINAINLALSPEVKEVARTAGSPYGDGNTSSKVADIVEDFLVNNRFNLKKQFYDIEFTV